MYADDTTLYIYSKNPKDIEHKLNADLCNIESWCNMNNLAINTSKSKFMLVGTKQRLQSIKSNEIEIQFCKMEIDKVNCIKLLGLYIDSKFNMEKSY
jgi:hypothetical protein